jgi:predicted transcriptional regulator of viral defense system
MGKEKHLNKVRELFGKSPVVSYDSIERIVTDKRKSGYTKQLVRNLITHGAIKKIMKGFYTSQDNPQLAVFCMKPAYLGLQDALSFHGLWEQETVPVIVTANRVRQGVRSIMGSNVLVRRIDRKYLFGFSHFPQHGLYLPYSDIEKTLIDLVYFREKISEDALGSIKEKLDREKLDGYLKRYPQVIRRKVMNLLGKAGKKVQKFKLAKPEPILPILQGVAT